MASDTDEPMTAVEYTLTCTDCSFETTVEGNFLDALDVADTHQDERGGPPVDRFVNVELDGRRD